MPAKHSKRKTSPLLFLLLILLVLGLPTAFLLTDMETQNVVAPPESTDPGSELEHSEFPVSSAGESLPPVSSPEPVVSHAGTQMESLLTETDIQRIEGYILAAKEEAASYVPPSGSGDSTSAADISSSPTQLDRPPLYGQQISVYFKDLESGTEYLYAPDEKYFVASLIKAPYCMYLYDLAEKGEIRLEDTITVTEKDIVAGTGTLQKLPPEDFPKDLTIRELLELSIRASDNTAMKALLRTFPAGGYLEYARGLGIVYPEDVRGVTNGQITARDTGVYLNALADFFAASPYASLLREDMLHTKNPMIRSQYPVVRKYGWASLSFHDMAVVEAEHPYLLAILTDRDMARAEDYQFFSGLTALFESILTEKYAASE